MNSRVGKLLVLPWSRGKTMSMLWLSVKYGVRPPDSRILCCRLISLETLSLVWSRGDLYSPNGRNCESGFALISVLSRWTIETSRRFCSGSNDLRFPNAVIGSAIKLGRGTNGTFSHGTSRLCREWKVFFLWWCAISISYQTKLRQMLSVKNDKNFLLNFFKCEISICWFCDFVGCWKVVKKNLKSTRKQAVIKSHFLQKWICNIW